MPLENNFDSQAGYDAAVPLIVPGSYNAPVPAGVPGVIGPPSTERRPQRRGRVNLRIAVMQPTYLPWAGYFNLIEETDAFVFLDDVQFSYQSWQQRNRIVVGGQAHFSPCPC